MSLYAQSTGVSVDRSESEIKKTLIRYGADNIVTGHSRSSQQAFVMFHYQGRDLRIRIPLPDESRFSKTPTGRRRKNNQVLAEWEQACRQQWRVLLLMMKAQLEAVENGLMTVDEAFLPWLLLPDGKSVSEKMVPHMNDLLSGRPPMKLLGFSGKKKEEA